MGQRLNTDFLAHISNDPLLQHPNDIGMIVLAPVQDDLIFHACRLLTAALEIQALQHEPQIRKQQIFALGSAENRQQRLFVLTHSLSHPMPWHFTNS